MNSSLWSIVALGSVTVIAAMTLVWLLSVRRDNYSYVDIAWSANFALLALLVATLSSGWWVRKWLIAGMFVVWSLRLAMHLAQRIVGHPEVGRYVELRRQWGTHGKLRLKFFAFFQLQALLNVVLSAPLLLAAANPAPRLHPLEWLGVAVWLVGLLGESIADAQLAAFKRDPANRGEVCSVGLWRYSRHPNYFFEWMIWIGYGLFAVMSPHGWLALSAPVLMLHFLLNVTGVKATEEQALRSKGEKYRRYQDHTSRFVPLPRRARSSAESVDRRRSFQ